MKISRRQWALIATVVTLLGALLYAFAPRSVSVELIRVTRGPLRVTVDEDGRTRIKERYVVSAPLGGQLRRIELHSGDRVTRGETLLAVIEPAAPDLLDPRTRAQLEARLRAAEMQLQLAEPRVERMRAAHQLAGMELARAAKLAEEQAIAAQDLDRARESARIALEDLRSAEYSRQIAGFELEQARAALLRTVPEGGADDCCWELRITSPINGQVLRVFHEDAAQVMPATRLLELGDATDLEAEIEVLSSDAVKVRPGARVWFEHWGGEGALEGRVRVIEPSGFLKVSALGVEEQRVNIIADFVTPRAKREALGDAYRVEARIVVWESDRVLKLPVGALFRSGGAWAVFVARNGRARLVLVELGHTNGREAEIVSGLAEGDRAILHPSDKVADGVGVAERGKREAGVR